VTDPEKAAQGVKSAQEDSQRPQGLIGWLKELPRDLEFAWLYIIPFVCILGVVVILIYASQLPSGVRWGACATALVIASSAFLVGGLAGFLFGVPRTVTVQGSTPSTGVTQYQSNTNLEQVSDWLTKIIVGVGLVQIGRIIPALSKFAESMKAPLGGQASSGAFGLGAAIASALTGFLFFYLWTRSIFLQELKDSSELNDQVKSGSGETPQILPSPLSQPTRWTFTRAWRRRSFGAAGTSRASVNRRQ